MSNKYTFYNEMNYITKNVQVLTVPYMVYVHKHRDRLQQHKIHFWYTLNIIFIIYFIFKKK